MSDIEFRDSSGKIVAEDADKRIFAARVLTYNTPDSYRTTFAKGVFTESLEQNKPVILWSHDRSRPVGRVIGSREDDEGLDLLVQIADTDAVPDARMAYALLRDGIVDKFSVGFRRGETEEDPNHEGHTRHVKGTLIETSIVVDPAVPGTKLYAVRAADAVPVESAVSILESVKSGEISAEEALAAIVGGSRTFEGVVTDIRMIRASKGLCQASKGLCQASGELADLIVRLRDAAEDVEVDDAVRSIDSLLEES